MNRATHHVSRSLLRVGSACLVALLALIAPCTPVARAAPADEEVSQVIADAVRGPSTARQIEMIVGLRVLRDPKLQPLFGYLAAHERADFRLQGMLGLAEISPTRRLSVPLVARIKDPVEQAAVVGQALRLNLLGPEEIAELAEWPRLDPSIEAVLWSKLSGRSPDSVDATRLDGLARGGDAIAAVLALQASAQLGDPDAPVALQRRLRDLPDDQRATVGRIALERVALDSLTSTEELAAIWLQFFSTDDALREPLLAALMVADPERGAQEWRRQYLESDDLGRRLVLANAALSVLSTVDPSVLETLADDTHPTLGAIGRAARAARDAKLDDPAMLALASQGHTPSSAWLIGTLRESPTHAASRVRAEVIELALNTQGAPPRGVQALVHDAARDQARHDPASFLISLNRSCAALRAELIPPMLTGAMLEPSAPIWTADSEPQWPDSQCAALALLLHARTGGELSPDQLDRLTLAARGGERLDHAGRAQSAWLVLSARGRQGSALANALGTRP